MLEARHNIAFCGLLTISVTDLVLSLHHLIHRTSSPFFPASLLFNFPSKRPIKRLPSPSDLCTCSSPSLLPPPGTRETTLLSLLTVGTMLVFFAFAFTEDYASGNSHSPGKERPGPPCGQEQRGYESGIEFLSFGLGLTREQPVRNFGILDWRRPRSDHSEI